MSPAGEKAHGEIGEVPAEFVGNEGSGGNAWASRLERRHGRKCVFFRLRPHPSVRIRAFTFSGGNPL